ncbi:MAG TPA: ribosome maturation factor RimM [Candidatus Binatia bacterium]|jgi:16S rRNA processing protein RimM
MAEPLVPLGEIVTTHGLNGWLKLNPFNLSTTALSAGVEVVLQKSGARTLRRIEASHPHRNQLLVKFQEVDNIDGALKYVGSTLLVGEAALESLPPGHYYHYQVVGFEVFSVSGARLGMISAIMSTPGGELYVVQGADKEHLIPAIKEFVEKVDFTAGRMIINPPDGLLDL